MKLNGLKARIVGNNYLFLLPTVVVQYFSRN